MYGLSYGTQLAQTYVAAHPEAVRAVVLDGALDLTRPMLDYDLGVVTLDNLTYAPAVPIAVQMLRSLVASAGMTPRPVRPAAALV